MGFLREKYSKTYFTGRLETGQKAHYGALGADEWRAGGIYNEIREPIDQVDLAGKRVLELGFGRGESARYLLQEVGAALYVGVDFSDAACELAHGTLAPIDRTKWSIECGDALEFLAERAFEETFDAVLMLDTIEHIPTGEMQHILPMLYNALVPGGCLIVDTPFYPVDEDYIAQGYRYVAPSASDLIPETTGMHCNKFTRHRLLREMRAAGFEVLGDKLFRRPLEIPLHLPADAGWSGLCWDGSGRLWAMQDAQILLPRRLFDGVTRIGFLLANGDPSDVSAGSATVAVKVCGQHAGALRFRHAGEICRFEVDLDAEGEDISIELNSSRLFVEPGDLPARIGMISELLVLPGTSSRVDPTDTPTACNGTVPSTTGAGREKVEYIDGANRQSAIDAKPAGAEAIAIDGALRVDRVEVIDPDSRRLLASLVEYERAILRCHMISDREIPLAGCRYTIANADGIVLSACTSGHGSLKRLFSGERAIVEFLIDPRLPAGEYRLMLVAGEFDSAGAWRDQEKVSTYAFRIEAATGGAGPAVDMQMSTVSVRPPSPRQRYCRLEAPGPDRAIVDFGFTRVQVRPHWFWEQFCSGWEPETFEVIRRFVRPDKPFLDVGSWIGPTTLIAAAYGAQRIVAVEGNPRTAEHLSSTLEMNPALREKVQIANVCVHRDEGSVQFGNADGSGATSSASSLRGRGFTVKTVRLTNLMRAYAVEDASLIKIDVEGAEVFLAQDLSELSMRKNCVIYLSLHPPFWKEMGDAADMMAAISRFRIEDPAGVVIPFDSLASRCTSDDPYPVWGTQMGNFFEVVLFSSGASGA